MGPRRARSLTRRLILKYAREIERDLERRARRLTHQWDPTIDPLSESDVHPCGAKKAAGVEWCIYPAGVTCEACRRNTGIDRGRD